MKKIFLISGMPHSATRLIYDLMKSTGEFSSPSDDVLNTVKELPVLHAYLTSLTVTTMLSEKYTLSAVDLSQIIESYISVCDGVENVLIKMPYYPVVYHDVFEEAARSLGYEVITFVVKRKYSNIVQSYVNRNEDIKYSQPTALLSQINRLPLNFKIIAFSKSRFIDVLALQYEAFEESLSSIKKLEIISVSELSYLQRALCEYGITGDVDYSIVDGNRLSKNRMEKVKDLIKSLERRFLQYRVEKY